MRCRNSPAALSVNVIATTDSMGRPRRRKLT
jgi:hypothetical protein